MKTKIIPSLNEKILSQNDFIISKTDIKGHIIYGNEIFITFSGYSEKELIGKPHNIIRHPDMPRGVFKFLWDTLTEKKECFAYVKNMSKGGSFYWVFANVTPDFNEQNQVTGYFSVRRKPNASAISVMKDIYHAMNIEEKKAGPKDARSASIFWLKNVLIQKNISYEQFILSL